METAARIVERMHARIFETVEPGLRKNELVADILHAGTLGTEDAGGDYAAIVPLLPSGPDAAAPHLTWDDRPFKIGRATSELQSLMRISYAVFCLKKKKEYCHRDGPLQA